MRFFPGPHEEIYSTCDRAHICERWLSASDFEAIKMESHLIARQSSQSGKPQVLDGIFGAVKDAPREVQENLNLWSRHAHSRRGLEAQISSRQNSDRRKIKESVWRTVLVAQDKLRLAKGSVDQKAEIIASLCSLQSLPAKQIAAMMGQSDYIASVDIHSPSRPRGFPVPPLRCSPNTLRQFVTNF